MTATAGDGDGRRAAVVGRGRARGPDCGVDFAAMFELEAHGPDTFVAQGPSYPWGGLYGGQIVAQALRAAAATVEPRFRPHSLHAYFIRRGDADEPIRLEVDRLRNGRSFVTRAVVARQSTGAILNLAASFQVGENAPDVQTTAATPGLAGPDEMPPGAWSAMFDRRAHADRPPGRSSAWLRIVDPIGDDPVLHACALAYLSDDMPTEAVATLHPESARWHGEGWRSASLDHAIWFHQPSPADVWQLHEFTCERYHGSRGLTIGRVFTGDVHVATVAQEVLLRRVTGG